MASAYFLYVDLPPSVGISVLNWESFQYGFAQVGAPTDRITYVIAPDNTEAATATIVSQYLDSVDPSIVTNRQLTVIVVTSNQLFGAVAAATQRGWNDLVFIVSSSGLGQLPPGSNVSLNYSGNQEVESTVIHQQIAEITTVLCIYEQNNRYCEDFVAIYRTVNLARTVVYIPLVLGQEQRVIDYVNHTLRKNYRRSPCRLQHLELLLVLFTTEANIVLSGIRYYPGIQALCAISADGLTPTVSKRFPIMIGKLAPLDITETLKSYAMHMLTFEQVPSSFAPAYYDAGIQLGQMALSNMSFTITNFANRLTEQFEGVTAQYGGAWINPTLRRVEFASYYYMWTYDPVIGSRLLPQYHQRSPWMPLLPASASLPYKINNAFWVQPRRWIVYYSPWRNMTNLSGSGLKLYLGIDSSTDTTDRDGNPFFVTGYASTILSIYIRIQEGKEHPLFHIPPADHSIFEYPLEEIVPITFD